ncbi:MAG TPA: CapA family protein [Ktedonobacterales bacterium]|nr:CapA family protein [Ktedonobacterales bacterium]
MTSRRDTRLTRREFIAAATATVVVAGCAPFSGGATTTARRAQAFATTTPVVIGGDATIPVSLLESLASAIAGHGGISSAYVVASPIPPPDLFITFGGAPKGYTHGATVGSSAWALVSHLRVPVESVTRAQAQGLLSGAINDWRAVGAPYSVPVKRFRLASLPTPSGVANAPGVTSVPSLSALLAALRANPGAVAVIPTEAADWSVHHLGVDGFFPAQGRGSGAGLGSLPLRLCVSDELAKQGADPAKIGASASKALAASQQTLDLVTVGDIMLGRGVLNQMTARNDFRFPYRAIKSELDAGDVRVGNLECMVTDLVQPPSDPATFTFICPSKGFDGLTYAGFDIVTLANNHSNGEGQAVFNDMRNGLTRQGIKHCGGGDNLAQAAAPAVVEAKGTRLAILSYDNIMPQGPFATAGSWGLAPIDVTRLPGDIAAARERADLVIPYFHWGIEYTNDPTSYQQNVARAAIDAGADMVLGNHPHWTQGIERYKDKLIIYSMGNFVFDQDWSVPTMEGMLLHLYWRAGTLVSVRFVPTKDVSRCQPKAMSPEEAVGVFNRMWSGTDELASGRYGP